MSGWAQRQAEDHEEREAYRDNLEAELRATQAERDRAQKACEQMGRRIREFEQMPSFRKLRNANIERQKEWEGTDQIDVAFRTLEVAGEAGEVAEAVKKHLRAVRGIKGSKATKEQIADEMGDLLVALDLLAMDLGINLDDAVINKFNATSEKYGLQTKMTWL